VVLAYAGDTPIGFALFFHNFSTFLGRHGLYLEDLFVVPEWRGKGVGKQLLAHIAAIAESRKCGRMEWAVLDWNESAIAFYRRMGAHVLDDWRLCRLTGHELRAASTRA
jgi:GNAT superfamily N-acetyltransferase